MEALLPSSISPKISAILQSHVYPRVGRVLRTLARFKSLLLDALGGKTAAVKRSARRRKEKHAAVRRRRSRTSPRKKGSSLVSSGFFAKPHLAWSGDLSPPPARDVSYHVYPSLESAWNAVVVPAAPAGGGREDGAAAEYCGYLRWLEEEMPDEVLVVEEEEEDEEVEVEEDVDGGGNEIDMLAEKFIARCRARFLLEKQESDDRRCQEIIARSI